MKKTLQRLLDNLIRIPPQGKRQDRLIPIGWFRVLQINRDIDYLCYKLFNFVLIVGVVSTLAILIDAHLALGFLVEAKKFAQDTLFITNVFSRIIWLPILTLIISFYLKIKLSTDLCSCDIPVFSHRTLLLTTSRSQWIRRSIFALFVSLLCIFYTHIFVDRIVLHYELQDSVAFILILQVFAIIAVAVGSLLLLTYALILEKVIRCFSDFEKNLQRNYYSIISN